MFVSYALQNDSSRCFKFQHFYRLVSHAGKADVVFSRVCACVCLSVWTETERLLMRTWCNSLHIDMWCGRSYKWLVSLIFDLEFWPSELFSYSLYKNIAYNLKVTAQILVHIYVVMYVSWVCKLSISGLIWPWPWPWELKVMTMHRVCSPLEHSFIFVVITVTSAGCNLYLPNTDTRPFRAVLMMGTHWVVKMMNFTQVTSIWLLPRPTLCESVLTEVTAISRKFHITHGHSRAFKWTSAHLFWAIKGHSESQQSADEICIIHWMWYCC